MSDEIAAQIEDRVTAILKAAATEAEERVYTDAETRIDKSKTYVRVACPSSRLVDRRHHGRTVIEIVDHSLSVVVFTTGAAAGGDPRRFARNVAAKLKAAIAANRTLKDGAGIALAFRTSWQSQAAAVDGSGESARAACQQTFLVRTATTDADPTKSLPQLAADAD